MEISKIYSHNLFPCAIFAIIFGVAGHHFETKPHIIVLGIIAICAIHYIATSSNNDESLQGDITGLREENENLKRNLMQVYSMVQQQKHQSQNNGPPPPIPPGMTAPPERKIEEESDEGAKPYL